MSPVKALALGLLSLLAVPQVSNAQQPTTGATSPTQPDPNSGPLRIRLPVITVTAEKTPEDKQKTPVSVTAVPRETL